MSEHLADDICPECRCFNCICASLAAQRDIDPESIIRQCMASETPASFNEHTGYSQDPGPNELAASETPAERDQLRAERDELRRLLAIEKERKRPWSPEHTKAVIDGQVKEIDRLTKVVQDTRAENARLREDFERQATQLRLCEEHAATMARDFDASLAVVQKERDELKAAIEQEGAH